LNLGARLLKNGTAIHRSDYGEKSLTVVGSSYSFPNTGEYKIILNSRPIEVAKNDQISFDVLINLWTRNSNVLDTYAMRIHSAKFEITPSRWYGAGSKIEISDILPDKRVLDWFRDLFKYLNIDVFYRKETNQVTLIHSVFDKEAVARLEVWDYEEDLAEKTNYLLEYNTDKQVPPENETLDFGGLTTETVKFSYSRTYFQECFRLIDEQIPTLWEQNDPRKFNSEVPERKTESNSRLLTYRETNSTGYNLTFGGELDQSETTDGAAVALWQELRIKEFWANSLSKENTNVQFKAKLTTEQILNFYNQSYFKAPIEIYNGDWSLGLVQVLEAQQMGGTIFTFKAKRI
jgi:hypothetical protein